ncbi:hypothetical protein [Massilia sp. 9096]|uniref:hypothetical protein n=1 Tax=Massilia sp. 9096 TaxID=1500894 RepID=UPI000569F616|nr:hypothetical protein [Massilia sp. 9096]
METTLRPNTSAGLSGATIGPAVATKAPARPAAAQPASNAPDNASAASPANAAQAAPLRSKATSVDGGLQDQVARAQQAVDYLNRIASQLESLKGELTAKLTGARSAMQTGSASAAASASASASNVRQQLETQVRQLTATLNARKQTAGGSVDANLSYTPEPAVQKFRIRELDLDSLQQNAPQTLAFSVGGVGGPQTSVTIQPDQSSDEAARAIDRALAPMGVRAGVDERGALVFSTPESNWPAVKDSIAVSGRGKVTADEVPASPAPQQWSTANTDALRQNLREVVQALERVRQSQAAASNALAAATVEVASSETPPPQVELAAQDFASAASNTDYDSLLALTSALVGVSRERVVALLGLR